MKFYQASRMHGVDDTQLRTITDHYTKRRKEGGVVLVVDDEPMAVRMMQEVLSRRGCETIGATSADEAIEILEQRDDITVLVSDMRMPGHDGAWLIRQCKQLYQDIRIVVCTAFAASADVIDRYADALFYKPLNVREFAHEVTLLLLKVA